MPDEHNRPFLPEGVAADIAMKKGKTAGENNITIELVQTVYRYNNERRPDFSLQHD